MIKDYFNVNSAPVRNSTLYIYILILVGIFNNIIFNIKLNNRVGHIILYICIILL